MIRDFALGCTTADDCPKGMICKIDEDVARSFNHEVSKMFAEKPKKGLCIAKPSGPTNSTDCEKGVDCQSDHEESGSSDDTFNQTVLERQTKIIDDPKHHVMKLPKIAFNDANLKSDGQSIRKDRSKLKWEMFQFFRLKINGN